ncbi:MAG: SDR family oxidoreductase [Rhizobiaceae bacterium]|nr:SDR family oxidoreductase [Rhizobiaceae bacterium]
MKLVNKIAMITGGSSGIGKATAKRLAKEGAHVAVIASSAQQKAAEVAKEIIQLGGKATPFAVDLRNISEIETVVAQIEDEIGPVDILVNSAGVYYPTPIGTTSEADFDRMVDVNLKGSFFTINALAPGMKARRRGHIVNVASVAAFKGSARFPLYCATKSAIVMLTKALASDLAPFDVHINAIAPGNTATPLNELERGDADSKAAIEAKRLATPSNRVYSPPEEMAEAILFLSTDTVRAMHGSTILLDEGLSSCV